MNMDIPDLIMSDRNDHLKVGLALGLLKISKNIWLPYKSYGYNYKWP